MFSELSTDSLPPSLFVTFIGRVRRALPRIAHRGMFRSSSWMLGFASNRLTIAHFRDVGVLGV